MQVALPDILTDIVKSLKVHLVRRAREDLIEAVNQALARRSELEGPDALLQLMLASAASGEFTVPANRNEAVLLLQDRNRLSERHSLEDQSRALTDALDKLSY